jgi:hypothetical protein
LGRLLGRQGGYFITLPHNVLDRLKAARSWRELQRRDPEARDGTVTPAAGANPPDGTGFPRRIADKVAIHNEDRREAAFGPPPDHKRDAQS